LRVDQGCWRARIRHEGAPSVPRRRARNTTAQEPSLARVGCGFRMAAPQPFVDAARARPGRRSSTAYVYEGRGLTGHAPVRVLTAGLRPCATRRGVPHRRRSRRERTCGAAARPTDATRTPNGRSVAVLPVT
jgi:hypothetical protein